MLACLSIVEGSIDKKDQDRVVKRLDFEYFSHISFILVVVITKLGVLSFDVFWNFLVNGHLHYPLGLLEVVVIYNSEYPMANAVCCLCFLKYLSRCLSKAIVSHSLYMEVHFKETLLCHLIVLRHWKSQMKCVHTAGIYRDLSGALSTAHSFHSRCTFLWLENNYIWPSYWIIIKQLKCASGIL